MTQNLQELINKVLNWSADYWWLIAAVITAWVFAAVRYWWLTRDAARTIHLAPISVKGGISKDVGSREAGLLLRAQLSLVSEIFGKERKEHAYYMEPAVGTRFRGMDKVLEIRNIYFSEIFQISEIRVKEELTVKVGPVQIPIGSIINLFVVLLRLLPVPFRRDYLSQLIHISLVSINNETQLLVYQKDKRPIFPWKSDPGSVNQNVDGGSVLALTRKVKGLAGFSDLLKDAAFMVIQLHGKASPGRNGRSIRFFADGIEMLDEYRRTGKIKYLAAAEEKFSLATAYDINNHEALYFYGSMLLIKRKPWSINSAIKVFKQALIKTEDEVLKGLIHAGLAFCYAQKIHRLAEHELDELEKARDHVKIAWEILKNNPSTGIRAWILLVRAQVLHADEGSKKNRKEITKSFIEALDLYCQAIKLEPENGTFYNNLGWVLLKLAEWEVEVLSEDDGVPGVIQGNTAKMAERYLRYSLTLNPQNKLSHANLCLLYASPQFRVDRDIYLDRCRYHGLRAIQVDPGYINGHRDLAVSLIRYREIDEAFKYFNDALKLAAEVEKDQEIIADVLKALKEMKVPKKKQKKWGKPNPDLLIPPHADVSASLSGSSEVKS